MNKKVSIEQKVLSENDRLADSIRQELGRKKILALNLVSSPGSGKTSLLEKTLSALNGKLNMALIAGDVQTENDADRLKKAGGTMVQPIVTGGACHLDAKMVRHVIDQLDLNNIDILFIENVGNLVCPASYDLGEDLKVALISTAEGDDKPLKYPAMFRRSSILILNKIDLLGFSDFNSERAKSNALSINGNLKIFEISCRRGDGLDDWYNWLNNAATAKKKN
ncbi:MAG: hydrogenase nickel incorporation protein HypB [Candidatus Zixiibacteriota bacterium]